MTKGNTNLRKNIGKGFAWSTRSVSLAANVALIGYITFYCTDVLGMSASLVGIILMVSKFFDGITDLISGFMIDNTRTKWGKARPYELCIVPIWIFTILLFMAPKASIGLQAAYVLIMYTLVQSIFVSLLHSGEPVYLLRSFRSDKDRVATLTVSSLIATLIGSIFTMALPKLVANAGTSSASWVKMVICISIPFAIIGLLRFFLIKEVDIESSDYSNRERLKEHDKKKEHLKFLDGFKAIGKNKFLIIFSIMLFMIIMCAGLLGSASIYYFKYWVGDIGAMSLFNATVLASLIMMVLFATLSNKFGKGNVLKAGLVIAAVGVLLRWVGGTNMVTMVVGTSLMFFGISPIASFSNIYVIDCIEYGQWKNGTRVEGMAGAVTGFATKIANGLAIAIGGFILGIAGYDGKLEVQTDSAMKAIDLLFNALPSLILIAMIIVSILFFNIDKVLPTARKELAERRADMSSDH